MQISLALCQVGRGCSRSEAVAKLNKTGLTLEIAVIPASTNHYAGALTSYRFFLGVRAVKMVAYQYSEGHGMNAE